MERVVCRVDAFLYFNSDGCDGRHLSSCYNAVSAKLNASAARSRCQLMGGDLATIESQAENDVVLSILRSNLRSENLNKN